jgi:hypothetical protein
VTLSDENVEEIARPPRRRRRSPLIIISSAVIAFLIVGGVSVLNAERIFDHLTVWSFEPSSAVSALANSSDLTTEGRFLFLASSPRIETLKAFNSQCSDDSEGFGILGCYKLLTREIHLFAISDPRLAGLDTVISAHEMLHAAWDRMSAADRATLVPLLEAEATRLKDDPAFSERMAYYAKNEPGQRANELHSIIATEVTPISTALETHYKTYFTNRAAIVEASTRTTLVITTLTDQITALSDKMTAVNAGIEKQYADYKSGYDVLNADIAKHNARNNFPSQSALDRAVNAINARQAVLDASYADLQQKTAAYEADYETLAKLISQTAALSTAINQAPPKELPPPAK